MLTLNLTFSFALILFKHFFCFVAGEKSFDILFLVIEPSNHFEKKKTFQSGLKYFVLFQHTSPWFFKRAHTI